MSSARDKGLSTKNSDVSVYSGLGIRAFARILKSELSERIDLFVKETEERYADDPDALGAKNRSQWMNEYSKWCKYKQGVKELAEKYLLGDTPG